MQISDHKFTMIFSVPSITTANQNRTQHGQLLAICKLCLSINLYFIEQEKKLNTLDIVQFIRTEQTNWKNMGPWLTVRSDDTA